MANLNKSSRQREIRVLIVDNNLTDRADLTTKIINMEFTPVVATGSQQESPAKRTKTDGGQPLIEDAIRKARESHCHAALVDMRLYDDRDMGDRSGFDLVAKLKPARCIIVTGYGTVPNQRLAQQHGAVTMVGKEEETPVLKEELERALVDLLRDDLSIKPEDWIEQQILPNLKSDEEEVTADDVRDLLMILFPDARELRLERLSQNIRSRSKPSSGLRKNSIVLRVYADNRSPFILKLASPSRIQHEKERFHAYVKDQLPGRRYAEMRAHKRLWNVGGISYTFLGENDIDGDISLFSTFYDNHSSEEIHICLEGFFRGLWPPLYEKNLERFEHSLFTEYDRLWSRQREQDDKESKIVTGPLYAKLDAWQYKDRDRIDPVLSLKLPDPRRWIVDYHPDSTLPQTKWTIVHGDLHGDNLFVEPAGYTWVIDFERTGVGHVMTDFVELEHDILSRLSGIEDTWVFYHLLIAVTTPRSLDIPVPGLSVGMPEADQSRVSKALAAIRSLRQLAHETFRRTDQREYYWGLLLDTLFAIQRFEKIIDQKLVTQTDLEVAQVSLERALFIGGILCRRLREWAPKWPPGDWPQPVAPKSPEASSVSNLTIPDLPSSQSAIKEQAKVNILFLAANPTDTVPLALDREYQDIKRAIRRNTNRERFELHNELAVWVDDWIELLLRHKPMIVHFSGHGSEDSEIILESAIGGSFPLPQASVKQIFEILNRKDNGIRCVVLNACFTEHLAIQLAENVDLVIGVSSTIEDASSAKFSAMFYTALGEGRDAKSAFDLACTNIGLHGLKSQELLRLISKEGVNPHEYYLL
jgi:CheY-like chemotaxis protein